MSNYTLIILLQSILIFLWVVIVKMNKSQIPEFDNWLQRKLQMNPSVHLEDAFNEYITEFNLSLHKSSDSIPEASIKLQLIEQYNIDDVFGGDEGYLSYKRSLRSSN